MGFFDNYKCKKLIKKGFELQKQGKHQESLECFDKVTKLDPENFDAWYNKGVEHRQLGDEGAAIGCFGRAIKIDFDRPSPKKRN